MFSNHSPQSDTANMLLGPIRCSSDFFSAFYSQRLHSEGFGKQAGKGGCVTGVFFPFPRKAAPKVDLKVDV